MTSMHACHTVLRTAVLALCALPTHGQTANTGAIAGTVSDPSGALVPSAAVVIRQHRRKGNSHGTWNEQGANVRLLILPSWWNTWRFRALAITLLLMSLAYAYYLQMQIIDRQFNTRLDERVNERTRIARDLHVTLLQSFHGLMFRFQAARNMVPRRPEEAVQALDEALERTEQAIAEGRDAIQGLRSSTAVTNELAQAVRALGGEMAPQDSASSPPDSMWWW